jgi:hypothetical protein
MLQKAVQVTHLLQTSESDAAASGTGMTVCNKNHQSVMSLKVHLLV